MIVAGGAAVGGSFSFCVFFVIERRTRSKKKQKKKRKRKESIDEDAAIDGRRLCLHFVENGPPKTQSIDAN